MTTQPTWMIKGERLADYLAACKEAATTDLFYHFKRDRRLTAIFEHATIKQAIECFKIASSLLHHTFTNDLYGAPTLYDFGNSIYMSPSTMQYVAVLAKLRHHFDGLTGQRIVEVGGGYGGQARTILDLYKPACYHIVDLPEVTRLQLRYLNVHSGQPVNCFEVPRDEDYDLCIANYSLSEIKDNAAYIEQVLARSKHGYITCNTDFVTLPWAHKKLPDVTGEENNFVLVW